MHPELRLTEDFLTDRGVLALPALPRMLYVVRGAINVGQRVLGKGELTAKVQLKVAGVSKGAREAIEKAGGSVEVPAKQVEAATE